MKTYVNLYVAESSLTEKSVRQKAYRISKQAFMSKLFFSENRAIYEKITRNTTKQGRPKKELPTYRFVVV